MKRWWDWLLWWRPPCMLRAVIVNVNTEDGEMAIQGVLWKSRGAWLVLVDAELLVPGQPKARLDGEAIVHRDRVLFIQRLP